MATVEPPDRTTGSGGSGLAMDRSGEPVVQPVVEPAVEPAADKSLGQLFGDMTNELSTLFHQEVELAKVETKQEVTRAAKAGGLMAGAGLVAHMAWLFFSLALAWMLDQWINRAGAFAIVGTLYAVVAAVLFMEGRKRAKQVEPVPRTVESLKEDVEWAKAQKN